LIENSEMTLGGKSLSFFVIRPYEEEKHMLMRTRERTFGSMTKVQYRRTALLMAVCNVPIQ
jgi:hypothetical protein